MTTLNDLSGKGEAVAWRHSKTLCLYETEAEVPLADGDEWAEPLYTTPQAECAPREAQPEPESACNPADICAGCRCEYSQSAAPTPERAQESQP
jgi:hypothetical protein